MRRAALIAAVVLLPAVARAEAEPSRFGAGGYFRVMTRPDAQGGDGRLGFWNLYGRLLNEGPYAALEMKLDVIPPKARSWDPWTSVHAKLEGGSVANADPRGGSLQNFRLSQLYVDAGNVGVKDVVWRLGTLDYYFGDLGLYDMKPAELFFDTVGMSATWKSGPVDVMVGAGDAGYFIRGANYDTIFSGGGMVRARLGGHLELGAGGQVFDEPQVVGNHLAPYQTPGMSYADYVRQDVVYQYYQATPGAPQYNKSVRPLPRSSTSWKAVGYLGFGKLGPIQWDNFFVNVTKVHPQNFYVEHYPHSVPGLPAETLPATETDTDFTLWVHDLTDQRMSVTAGNEMHLTVIPHVLDAAWGVLWGEDTDGDNKIAPSDFARTYYSTVVRAQLYVSQSVHLLGETSIAKEHSTNGNTYRDHKDSIFQSSGGVSSTTGLEYGDDATRDTWQGKLGVVLNPAGYGVFTRPSIRVLYGLQYSSQNNAFGNSFVTTVDASSQFDTKEDHLHQVVALEAEAWF